MYIDAAVMCIRVGDKGAVAFPRLSFPSCITCLWPLQPQLQLAPLTLKPTHPASQQSGVLNILPFEMPWAPFLFHPHCPSPLKLPFNRWPKQCLFPSRPMAIQCPSHSGPAVCSFAGHTVPEARPPAEPFTVQLQWALHSIPPHLDPLVFGRQL